MTEGAWEAGPRLRLARQARGLSQQQLAGMAGVSRQAVSAVESGHSDPSLRVALALASALGVTVEALFGPGAPAEPVLARPVAPVADRVALAVVGDVFVALPLRGDAVFRAGFTPAGGLACGPAAAGTATGQLLPMIMGRSGRIAPRTAHDHEKHGNHGEGTGTVAVRPIAPPRPTLVVAGCDPALPLLETPLALLDPPVGFLWWPCGSAEALRLAAAGLVHVAGVHPGGDGVPNVPNDVPDVPNGVPNDVPDVPDVPGDAEVVGFASWREGLVVRPGTPVKDLSDVARRRLRLVNREPGAQARTLLDRERTRLGIAAPELPGYDGQATGHLQVASAVAGRVADAGVSSEPAALAYQLDFIPLADERFDLVLPAKQAASREVQALLKVLTSPWLLAQLASLPGYDPASCGERLA